MKPLGKPKPLDQTIVLDFKPNQQKLSLNHLAFAFMLLAGNTFFQSFHLNYPSMFPRDVKFLNYPLGQLSKKKLAALQSLLKKSHFSKSKDDEIVYTFFRKIKNFTLPLDKVRNTNVWPKFVSQILLGQNSRIRKIAHKI